MTTTSEKAPVARFHVEKRLPACRVDKDLLVRLEDLLRRKMPLLQAQLGPYDNADRFSMSITDGFGTESLDSIKDYSPPYLPDTTSSVSMGWNSRVRVPYAECDIRFSSETAEFNRIQITTQGDQARAVAGGLLSDVMREIDSSRTLNQIFHPPFFFVALPMFIVTVLFLPFTVFRVRWSDQDPRLIPIYWMGIARIWVIFAFAYYASYRWFKPYVSFVTVQSQRRDSAWNWLALFVLGLMLTALATALWPGFVSFG